MIVKMLSCNQKRHSLRGSITADGYLILQVNLEVCGGLDLQITTPKRSQKVERRANSSDPLARLARPASAGGRLAAWRGSSSEHQLVAHLARQQKKK